MRLMFAGESNSKSYWLIEELGNSEAGPGEQIDWMKWLLMQ
jgi:hypothetical protein